MIHFNEIGTVKSAYKEVADPFAMREHESIIEIKKEYADGLFRLEESSYIEVIFCFDKAKGFELQTRNYYGEFKGVFATRSPRRPAAIGLSKVKLIKREGNMLYVLGLDALDGTPVLDIKPFNGGYPADEIATAECDELKVNPRKKIIQYLKNRKLPELLILSGTLHGHYCPGLSMGVIAAVHAVNTMRESSDGMEDILAVMEINSCFADAVQFITGCTLGNNSLLYRDLGKTAVSLVKRDGMGIRLAAKPSYREKLKEDFPEFSEYFNLVVVEKNRNKDVLFRLKKLAAEASFRLLAWDINDIFKIGEVKIELPDYAPIRDTVFCTACGEGIMKEKEVIEAGKPFCKSCREAPCFQLDGAGITLLK